MAEVKNTVQIDPFQSENEGKYLTFQLAEEGYGIGILKVREIIGMLPVTPVPQTPMFLKGVINLRGQVIP
ncbi:MAG: chemotaxis protein CheW, partial [Candidatus Adiutrix sp.]|nr:chemotaxis protein CheW [Candidatus Adiutrix sp.]